MTVQRRDFLRALGVGTAGVLLAPRFSARGAEAATLERSATRSFAGLIRLDSNENPIGPFPGALDAIRAQFGEANRYPDDAEDVLVAAIAAQHGVRPEQVILGCGSGELLQLCAQRFTAPTRGLVSASPTFETPARFAKMLGHPVTEVRVTGALQLDLDAMAVAARGAGLVFLCNPNNPTGTVHGAAAVRDFIARVHRESSETMLLVDEAYHEYVDAAGYSSYIPEVKDDAHVIVSRTFSKVFGLAGLRVGYAIAAPATARALAPWRVGSGVNQLAAVAALASLSDTARIRAEQERNRTVKRWTREQFERMGYAVGASDANFLMVDIKRDIRAVRAACRAQGVAVGRPFPPLDTHLRLTIGTADEMERAMQVLGGALKA
ncbi:MAG: aminotransferase class I/II-fold pyridoxal phosphate-dependent enzyme [Gemmatimonadaceae bacterium]|nr:aminotransferase class I/II-fold pyridoxal phosphate-dependent enzyme [Gemmatimonadaceae bacterium]